MSSAMAAPDGPWLSGRDVPSHGRLDPFVPDVPDSVDWFGADAVGDWLDGEEPPEPQWALDASDRELRERLAAAVQDPAGAATASVIEALTPDGTAGEARAGSAGLDAAGLLDGIVATQRLINHYQAVQRQWLAALARPGVAVGLAELVDACRHPAGRASGSLRPPDAVPADLPLGRHGVPDLRPLVSHPAWRAALADTAARLASAEVGCALRLAPVTARIRVEDAVTMIDALPATHTAQRRGDVDGYRASIIADRTAVLDADRRRAVEQCILPGAGARTPAALRDQVDRTVIAADPDAARRRVERAKAGRGVRLDKDIDDMAVFRAQVHCADGQLAYGVLDEQATALTAAGLADGRGAAQLRADVFCDLFRTLAATGHAHLTARPGATSAEGDAVAPGGDPGATAAAPRAGGGAGQRFSDVAPCLGHDGDHQDGHRDGRCGGGGCQVHSRSSGGPLGSVARYRRPTALNVYLDAATVAGLADLPGELAGYGTVTAETARALAASADTVRALVIRTIDGGAGTAPATAAASGPECGVARDGGVAADVGAAGNDECEPSEGNSPPREGHSGHPARSRACGTELDAGRAVYRPPDPVLDYVTARDRWCAWPGCRASGARCDADHRLAYRDGGATCPCNLDLLCRWHHRVKTFTAWRAEPGPDGTLVWISPTGRHYPAEPGHPLLDRLITAVDSGRGDRSGLSQHGLPDPPVPDPPVDDSPPF